jgi:acyl transferase domain-containing protein/acyl carrier protein
VALAGGVTIMVTPATLVSFSQQRGLAADGRCKAFSAEADGMGMADGAGMLVLERLSDARRNGHPVLAVVRGSAINQDGASNGLTAPNGPSQQRVIRAALASAGLTPADVDAVEAHGTGTTLGDPIEAQALLATYGQDRPADRPAWLGSVKSNIGHTQCAAGVAGVMKMVLALGHEELPATLHAENRSPHVDWSAGDVRLLTEAVSWPRNGRPRLAGISSFGFSGTNAHAIIQEPPVLAAAEGPGDGDDGSGAAVLNRASGVHAWPVSSRSARGLREQAKRLAAWAGSRPDLEPADVAWSLATTRSVFEHRAVVLGSRAGELSPALRALAAGEPSAGVVSGSVPPGGPGQTVFVFPGQGGQWAGMGVSLAACSPVFAARLAECSAALLPYTGWRVEEMLADATALARVDVVQPVLWAVMVSLAAVWEAAGVTPAAVAGHSQGEIAAAVVAGILSLDDAARVVALRSRAITALAGRGGMASVAESADAVRERLADLPGSAGSAGSAALSGLSVAAVNGPDATVVSGDPAAVAALVAACVADGVRARVLPVDYASHGPQVEALEAEITAVLAGIVPGRARISMVSAMTGKWLDGPELDAGYWYASLRAPVEFARSVRVLAAGGHRVFVEVSPHPVLAAAITATVEGAAKDTVVTGTLRRDDGGAERLLASLAAAHVAGADVDWARVLPAARRLELPTYAFQRDRYWPEQGPGVRQDLTEMGLGTTGHSLLGAEVELVGGQGLVLTGQLSPRTHPWLADHAVGGTLLLPATAFVELATVAAHRAGCGRVAELALHAPLAVPERGAIQIQVSVASADSAGQRAVEIHARRAGGDAAWSMHASGTLAPAEPAALPDHGEFLAWPPDGAVPADVAALYDGLAAGGFRYGPAFRGLRAAWVRGSEVFAEVGLPDGAGGTAGFGLHPALLDAALQASALSGQESTAGEARLPFAWDGVSVYAAGASALRVRIRRDVGGSLSVDAADTTGTPVVSVGSLVLRPVPTGQRAPSAPAVTDALFVATWRPATADDIAGVNDTVPADGAAPAGRGWAVAGRDPLGFAAASAATGTDAAGYPGLDALGAAVAAGEPVPAIVLAYAGDAVGADDMAGGGDVAGDGDDGVAGDGDAGRGGGAAAAARRAVWQAAELVRQWTGLTALAGSRLVIVTRGAVESAPGEGVTDLAGAAVWGLVRTAQADFPGRVVLAGLPAGPGAADDARISDDADDAGIPDALSVLAAALRGGEPELAVRGGIAYLRRVVRPEPAPEPPAEPAAGQSTAGQSTAGQPSALVVPGTVLVTGGTGTLGGQVARHLAATRRARHLVLLSRSGPAAAGAAVLAASLATIGTEARITACDVADRRALAAVLSRVPADVPLTGVIHAAGVPDAAAAGPLTATSINAMMRPKADAAWHLHELTAGAPLQMFVLFSGAAGALGGGQWTGAAGDAFLDALAGYRQAAGRPAKALAWGPWAGSGRMAGHGHLKTGGRDVTIALSAADGLALFDAALRQEEAALVPARLDVAGLRARASRGEDIPALWHSLAGAPAVQVDSAAADALRRQLAALPPADQDRMLLNLVRAHVAAVLGHASPAAIEPDQAFSELGFDSVTAVELRNRLNSVTGLRLPATVIFDYPAPAVLAGYLRAEIAPETEDGTDSADNKLRTFLASVPLSRLRDAGLIESLMQLAGIHEDATAARAEEKIESIDALDAESLVRMALDSGDADY